MGDFVSGFGDLLSTLITGGFWSGVVTYAVLGLITAASYAIASSGLVITYATSNVFNMAHGAIGMVMAFAYWQIKQFGPAEGPWVGAWTLLSLVLVVAVIAPLFGAFLERLLMRHLTDASVTVSLTVTVGLLVLLFGLAQAIWKPGTSRFVSKLFPDGKLGMPGTSVSLSVHQIITLVLAGVVAVALYLLLQRTRTGIGMRAIVDNRLLLSLHGARPERLGMLSWALGSSLAALAGILLVAGIGVLDYITLTFIVVAAFSAAMLGKLTSLPRTFVGAIILGFLIQEFTFFSTQLPDVWTDNEFFKDLVVGILAALPTIFLFVAMLAIPSERLRVGRVEGAQLVPLASRRRTLVSGAVVIGGAILAGGFTSTATTANLARGFAMAAIMLSLVLLAGYGGDMSLGQLTFAGFGALTITRWVPIFGDTASIPAILAGGVVAAVLGALVALPALRLRGLYLGLGTLAFASAMDELVFSNASVGFNLGGFAEVGRPSLPGLSFESERGALIFCAIGFVLLGVLVLELRRSRFGRLLLASRDSPAACGTLGQSITATRVVTFALASGIAGIGGGLLGVAQVAIGSTDFQMFQNLPLLLLAVIGGVTSVTGALIGGIFLGMQGVLIDALGPEIGGAVVLLLIGGAAVGLGRNPNGLAGALFGLGRRMLGGNDEPPGALADEAVALSREELEEVTAGAVA